MPMPAKKLNRLNYSVVYKKKSRLKIARTSCEGKISVGHQKVFVFRHKPRRLKLERIRVKLGILVNGT